MSARTCSAILIVILFRNPAFAAEYYISPGGSNGNAGSADAPWGTFNFAIGQLNAGDTLFVYGGTYELNSRVRFESEHAGTAADPIRIWAVPGESPVLDFASMSAAWGSSSGRGIQIDGGADWLHLKDLTIQNARDNGIWSGANNGIFEHIITRWNGDSGLQLADFASHNLILNSDSYENYDPSANGENADGFAIKFADLGPGNVVRGSRAWGNADDGWDMWESTLGGVLVEDSWAFDNGKIIPLFFEKELLELDDLDADGGNFNGDGNGFKLGQDGGPHALNRVLAWENAVRGIDLNRNGFGVTVNNSTVYNSGRNWDFDENDADTLNQHVLRNNISFAGSDSDRFFSGVDHSFNTWNGIAVSADDFLSLDDSIASGPRLPDGSLPISDFLRLRPDGNLIDAGLDVGLPYFGEAPDLGAFETTPAIALPGDYSDDGVVNTADYILWRNNVDTDFVLANDASPGSVDASDYLVWRENFGAVLAGSSQTAVPEPSVLTLLVLLASHAALAVRMK
jgi:hypothetical protein